MKDSRSNDQNSVHNGNQGIDPVNNNSFVKSYGIYGVGAHLPTQDPEYQKIIAKYGDYS